MKSIDVMLRPCILVLMTSTALSAHAESSVTLYGIVDNGIFYQSNATTLGSTTGGKPAVKFLSGTFNGSRFGLKGSEDLGGGTKAIFTLESGFNATNGAQQFSGAEFGRLAFVGISDKRFGSLTAGRQYTSYFLLTVPYSPTLYMHNFGAHPGDIDSFDTVYRTNNALVYTSPKWHGFTVSGSYALGGNPGSLMRGTTWSAAVQYITGPFGIASGIQKLYNATPGGGAFSAGSAAYSGGQQGISALTNGYQTAQSQQRFAVVGGWEFTRSLNLSVTYSNVQYTPGINSLYRDNAIFNTFGAVLHWDATPALGLSGSYSYTKATRANGISDPALYQQYTMFQSYSLSKRTTLYAVEAYQHASGQTLGTSGAGNIIDATASIGDAFQSAPSSTGNQIEFGLGLSHRF